MTQGPSTLGRYGYDYEGLRILKIGDDGRRHYTYDQLSVITESTISNVTVSKYDYGLDQLVSLNNTVEGRSFFHLDGLRSTANLTDEVGATRQSILYDAWGNERDRVGTSANNFTFTGHEKDEETGLIYAKARFYDPDIGRFLNQDRLLGTLDDPPSLHRFVYVGSNPTRFVDITGLSGEDVRVLNEIYSAPWQTLGREVDALRANIDRAIDAGKEQARYSAVLGLKLLARMWEMGPGNAGHVTPEWAAENYVQPENDDENALFQLQDLALIVGPLARSRGGASTPRSGSLSRTSTLTELETATRVPETPKVSTQVGNAPRATVVAEAETASASTPIPMEGSQTSPSVMQNANGTRATASGPRPVGSRMPVNSKYAGRTYPAENLPPELAQKYPNSVRFTDDGFADFSPYSRQAVKIKQTGDRPVDFDAANKAAGLERTPQGYTWHHHEDGTTMQLVPTDIHAAVKHTGGVAVVRAEQAKAAAEQVTTKN